MVEITVDNISGLYNGVLANMAANLAQPVNDNEISNKAIEEAIAIMTHMMEGESRLTNLFDQPECDVNEIVRRIESRMDKYEKALQEIELLMEQDQSA